jgi:hypothetical protein
MKDFVRPAGRLRALPYAARLVYSVFLVFTLIGLAFTAWLGADMLKPDLSAFAEYYAGVPTAPLAGEAEAHVPAADGGGPVLELPGEALAPAAADPIPLRKLLEVSHFHLFSLPVYLLILSHLFMLSALGARTKLIWIGLASLAVAAHIAAPWFARSGSSAAKGFYAGSGALLAAAFLVMSIVPLLEMWTGRTSR